MTVNSHSYIANTKNDTIKIFINGKYYKRNEAKISVFDSGFLLGDGIWESFRLHNGKLCFIDEHIDRLIDGAQEISIKLEYTKEQIIKILYKTIQVNNMYTDVHIRLIISRGLKTTPYQHPDANEGKHSIVIIPEFKTANKNININGLNLKTVSIIRGSRFSQNPNINSLSKYNCIAACIEADNHGADEALMLDINKNVSTCNSTNFFIIKNKEVWTSTGEHCLKGITRQNIIEICKTNNIPIFEKNFTLNDVYGCSEAFITGTFAGVIPIIKIDNHIISSGKRGKITEILYRYYKNKINMLYPENAQ